MIRTITLKHAGNCAKCGTPLQAGNRARWTPGKVWCLSNDHRGNQTRGQYRARMNIAEGTINFEFANGRITVEERDAKLAKLRG